MELSIFILTFVKQIKTRQIMENAIYVVVAECMGTDGEFSSEVLLCRSLQDAGETASSLIADMAMTMDYEIEDAMAVREIGTDDWWYRVRVENLGNSPHYPSKHLTDTAESLYDVCAYGFYDTEHKLDFANNASAFVEQFMREYLPSKVINKM